MAQKRKLLTFSSDHRWRKQINGVMRYFGYGKSASDHRSYQLAERRYFDFLAQQETPTPVEVPVSTLTLTDAAESYLRFLYDRVEDAQDNHDDDHAVDDNDDDDVPEDEDERKEEGLSPSSWSRSAASINLFVAHFNPDKRIASISALDLDSFRSATDAMRKKGPKKKIISRATVKCHVAIVAHFLAWCYRRELLDHLPRNLSEFVSVRIAKPTVKVFSVDELKTLWGAASSRTRLYMALGLNCGFGQSDISALIAKDWDRTTDIITHPRSKTGVFGKYRLWPVTAGLLREHARKVKNLGDTLLVGDNGRPLVHSALLDGKLKKTDAVRSAFARVQNSTGVNGHRGFYALRKTAASEIERINPMVTGMFLAHSDRRMARHYALPHWEALDVAVAEMGRRFDFLTL